MIGLGLLATPSGRPWDAGPTPPEPPRLASQPLQEIFPVDMRAWTAAAFCAVTFLITFSLALFLPFALLAPFPAAWVLGSLACLWLAAELLLGVALSQLSPRLDPRRPAFSWWRLAAVAVAIAAAVVVFFWLLTVLARNEQFLWILAACRELFHDHPVASIGLAALVIALLELLVILDSLRRHEERRFDCAR